MPRVPSGGAGSRPLQKQQENSLSAEYQLITASVPTPDGLGGTGRRPMLSGRPSDRQRRPFVDGLNCVGTGGTALLHFGRARNGQGRAGTGRDGRPSRPGRFHFHRGTIPFSQTKIAALRMHRNDGALTCVYCMQKRLLYQSVLG